MRYIPFVACFIFLSTSLFGQQFRFEELIEFVKDSKKFEQRMFSMGNKMIDIERSNGHSATRAFIWETVEEKSYHRKKLDECIPTANPNYDEKWLFPSGDTFTSSEIFEKGLDRNFVIRNQLIKLGQPLNKDVIDGFYYNSSFNKIYETKIYESSFGQNYNRADETGTTFYNLRLEERAMIYPEKKPMQFAYANFEIFYVDRDTYLSTLREIQDVCEYVYTFENDYGEFESKYDFGSYAVFTREGSKYGGHVRIKTYKGTEIY